MNRDEWIIAIDKLINNVPSTIPQNQRIEIRYWLNVARRMAQNQIDREINMLDDTTPAGQFDS